MAEEVEFPRILSVVPYHGGWASFVAFDHDGESYRIIGARSFLASSLVPIEGEVRRGFGAKDKRRVADRESVATVCAEIREALAHYSPGRVIVESSSEKSRVSLVLANAIGDECMAQGFEVEPLFMGWRTGFGYGYVRDDNIKVGITERFGSESTAQLEYAVTTIAAGMVLHILHGNPAEVAQCKPSRREIVVPGETVPRPAMAVDIDLSPEEQAETEPALPAPLGPVSAGIDPGSRYLALAIGEGTEKPVTLRYLRTYEVGEAVQLAKPKVIQYALGGQHIIRTRRVMTPTGVGALASKIVAKLVEHGVTRLTIEHFDSAHISEAQTAGAASSIATGLIRTLWIATEVACRAQLAGIEVVRVRAATWRARVVKRTKAGGDGAEHIPETINAGFVNWPQSSNEHERDAGGILLYGVTPIEVSTPAEARDRGSKAPRVKRSNRNENGLTDKQQARIDGGCTCVFAQHVTGCPMYAPKYKTPKWAQKALGQST